MVAIKKNITISGKRKRAIAKATIVEGEGRVFLNKIPIENLDFFKRLEVQEPIEIAKKVLGNFNFDIFINTKSGGSQGQIQAARLAIARAIISITKSQELKRAYTRYDKNLLVADTRRKETYKPGDSKARKKRQKSFR
jgi:small subunit ribosomal protein S9